MKVRGGFGTRDIGGPECSQAVRKKKKKKHKMHRPKSAESIFRVWEERSQKGD